MDEATSLAKHQTETATKAMRVAREAKKKEYDFKIEHQKKKLAVRGSRDNQDKTRVNYRFCLQFARRHQEEMQQVELHSLLEEFNMKNLHLQASSNLLRDQETQQQKFMSEQETTQFQMMSKQKQLELKKKIRAAGMKEEKPLLFIRESHFGSVFRSRCQIKERSRDGAHQHAEGA
jgi:hypothetical protein